MSARKKSVIGSFFSGLFFGILICLTALAALAFYAVNNPDLFLKKALNMGAGQVIESKVTESVQQTVESIPKDYVAMRQKDINRSFNQLTTAYGEGRLSSTDMQMITGFFYQIMADQKITPKEIEKLLKFIDSLTK